MRQPTSAVRALRFESGSLVTVDTTEVRLIVEQDRPALCRMLEESDDFPQELLYLYRRNVRLGPYLTFVALRDYDVVGMLTGSFDSDFFETRAFDPFELPPAPHAFIERVHVRAPARGSGIGRALIQHYATEGAARGCTFVGGSLDLSSDPSGRRTFFERLGFSVRHHDNFGAPLWHLV
jgi:GNAT superfamily N-acetyltransferase